MRNRLATILASSFRSRLRKDMGLLLEHSVGSLPGLGSTVTCAIKNVLGGMQGHQTFDRLKQQYNLPTCAIVSGGMSVGTCRTAGPSPGKQNPTRIITLLCS